MRHAVACFSHALAESVKLCVEIVYVLGNVLFVQRECPSRWRQILSVHLFRERCEKSVIGFECCLSIANTG